MSEAPTDEELLDFDFTLSPNETEALLAVHKAEVRIAELLGKPPRPDPLRTLLAIGLAWLHRIEVEGGCEAMAAALAQHERGARKLDS